MRGSLVVAVLAAMIGVALADDGREIHVVTKPLVYEFDPHVPPPARPIDYEPVRVTTPVLRYEFEATRPPAPRPIDYETIRVTTPVLRYEFAADPSRSQESSP